VNIEIMYKFIVILHDEKKERYKYIYLEKLGKLAFLKNIETLNCNVSSYVRVE